MIKKFVCYFIMSMQCSVHVMLMHCCTSTGLSYILPPFPCPLTHQKGAQKDEGNKIEICKLIAALIVFGICFLITGLSTQTGEHDLMPSLTCRTPKRNKEEKRIMVTRIAHFQVDSWNWN